MMYAIRLADYSKPFIRNDGLCTSSKAAAKLFETVDEAHQYINEWRVTSGVNGKQSLRLEILEVETKPVLQSIRQVIETL